MGSPSKYRLDFDLKPEWDEQSAKKRWIPQAWHNSEKSTINKKQVTQFGTYHYFTGSRSTFTFQSGGHTESRKTIRGWLLLFPTGLWRNRCFLHYDLAIDRKREKVKAKGMKKEGYYVYMCHLFRETAQSGTDLTCSSERSTSLSSGFLSWVCARCRKGHLPYATSVEQLLRNLLNLQLLRTRHTGQLVSESNLQ